MLKIRRPLGRLIFNMGIAIPGKTVFLIETAPRCCRFIENMAFIDHKKDNLGYHPTLCWFSLSHTLSRMRQTQGVQYNVTPHMKQLNGDIIKGQ